MIDNQTFAPYISPKHYPSTQKSISQEQALILLKKYRATGNTEYKNLILTGNMRRILALCSRPEYQFPNIFIYDLVQEASIGFLKGIELYNPYKAKAASIATYAYSEARGHIIDFIRETGYNVRIPDNCHRAHKVMMKRLEAAQQEHETEHIPPDTLIADKHAYQIHGAISILTRSYSDPASSYAQSETSEYSRSDLDRIVRAGESLPEPQRSIFMAYFGLSEDSFKKLSKKHNFTEQDVEDIIKACITKIRKEVGFPDCPPPKDHNPRVFFIQRKLFV